ncbi:MAG TPA: type II toxin-antitoxin system RelE/ParE family toxin [Candidatus Sulfotelmatobacter sp.]|nr:type II toxin-antitoxin system RelE/ParE family toxin [Candidatus Sulfotelmatobacter sp.]
MAFRVEMSAQAEEDASSILDWLLSQHAGETGLRWFLAMEEAIESLSTIPERCPRAPENEHFPFEVRQLLYGSKPHVYRILFTIDANVVRILHVRHARRRPIEKQ